MLNSYFNTGDVIVNSIRYKKSVIIYPTFWINLFLIVIVWLCYFVAFTGSSLAYAQPQSLKMTDDGVLSENAHTYISLYQPTNEGQSLEFTISATDPDGDPLTFTAYGLPEGASFDAETLIFSWTPRYDQAGVYVVRFEVSDGELTDYEDVTINVVQLYEDWDVNGDEAANILDMVLVGQHWDETGLTGWIREDANEDGTISVLDMIVIGQNWTG